MDVACKWAITCTNRLKIGNQLMARFPFSCSRVNVLQCGRKLISHQLVDIKVKERKKGKKRLSRPQLIKKKKRKRKTDFRALKLMRPKKKKCAVKMG